MRSKVLLFITKRLVFSRQNKGIVHIISLISLISIAIGSFAMVVVLSVFNGFTNVAQTMLEKSCPSLLVEPAKGKLLSVNTIDSLTQQEMDFLSVPVIKTTALISFGPNRHIANIVGIDQKYFAFLNLDTAIVSGKEVFDINDSLFSLMGINLSSMIGLGERAERMNLPIKITVPNASSNDAMVLEDKLKTISLIYQGSFQTHSDLDDNTVFVSLSKARELLLMPASTCNYLYIIPKNKKDTDKIKTKLENTLTDKYHVKNILEQESLYFRIVKTEKLAVYIILSFIIFIASINIISAIIILYIQKQKMNKILRTLGVRVKDLKRIYFTYGVFINLLGVLVGICLGLVVCLLQERFGIIKLAQDSFVVDAFPIKIMFRDILSVFLVVLLIGSLSIHAITTRIKEKI